MLVPTNVKKGSKERKQYEKDNAHLLTTPPKTMRKGKHPGLKSPKSILKEVKKNESKTRR